MQDTKFNEAALLTVEPSPHIKRRASIRWSMLEVIIALIPACAFGVYIFGWRALFVLLISVASAVLSEFVYQKFIIKKRVMISDCSAALTGLLLGMNLPASVPLWLPVVGSAFAIIIVKQLFGGIGRNFLNPALAARAFLFFSWPAHMGKYVGLDAKLPLFAHVGEDIQASATVLAGIKDGGTPSASLLDMFFGKCDGTIGEISALLLLVGGIYLLIRGIISWHIPVTYLGTCAVMFFIFPQVAGATRLDAMLYELLSGGLMLGAIFMATDYVTCPITKWGRVIFGVGCGLLTFFFRCFGANAEGVSFAILIMNSLVWYIDFATKPRIFGTKGVKKRAS